MENLIYVRHGNLFVVINTLIEEIIDVFNNTIEMTIEYPNIEERQLG